MAELKRHRAFFLILFLLTLGALFLIIPAHSGVSALQGDPTSTPTPTGTVGVLPSSQVTLYAFVDSPSGILNNPYVILSAFANLPEGIPLQIRGVINENLEFECTATPCKLLLTNDSVLRYYAFTDLGHKSQEYSATVRIQNPSVGQYQVTIEATEPHVLYSDRCASIWSVYGGQLPAWANMPSTPAQLNTGQTLYYLAGKLITSGIVDASSCPSNGLETRNSPNACGLEKARQSLVEWQNKFDLDIWLTGYTVGVPPKLLKTLIMRESQFWPENTRYFLNEYGLAQINDYGADVALRWDPDLYQQVCKGVLSDCSMPYVRISSAAQAMLRGVLIDQLNVECPTCKYGLNVELAHTSVYTIARVLHANCWETHYILDRHSANLRNYEDLWKLTMVSYHSGYYCLDSAVEAAAKSGKGIDWSSVSDNLSCAGARQYVDDFWNSLTGFDNQVLLPAISQTASITGALPTPTPGPTPTPAISRVRVAVTVYVDSNADGTPQPSEGVSGVSVKLTFPDNSTLLGVTDQQGGVVFDLTGRPVGQTVVVSLPNLYRRENIILPATGVVNVLFKFNQPNLPPATP